LNSLPLFPLRAVLFPGGLLPLRIFETRYVDMIGRCMREAGQFGVIMIGQGAEVGDVETLATLGTSARVVDFEKLSDGLLGILCRGDQRFRLHRHSTLADGLHVGEVEWLSAPPHVALTDAQRPLGAVLRKVIHEYGSLGRHLQPDFTDASWVSFRFAELLPLSRDTQQHLLEIDDPAERLELLAPMIDSRQL
jgi:Lon protease-like protein